MKVFVNGKDFTNFISVNVDRYIDTLSGSFTLEVDYKIPIYNLMNAHIQIFVEKQFL